MNQPLFPEQDLSKGEMVPSEAKSQKMLWLPPCSLWHHFPWGLEEGELAAMLRGCSSSMLGEGAPVKRNSSLSQQPQGQAILERCPDAGESHWLTS